MSDSSSNHPAVGNHSLEAAASRPSKNNCTTTERDAKDATPGGPAGWRRKWWRQKNGVVSEFLEERPARASRPISVRGDVKIREEAASEKHNGEYRSQTWSTVLRKFLTWYNGYRHSHLVFRDPDGEKVRSKMLNSHHPQYGDKYYARLKALERQMVRNYDDLHIAMLTFTGSNRNENGGWRCPADHLRDVVSSWRPDRGRGVYHALRDSLEGMEWEYGLVVEKHKSGYAHVHCAVFVDGEISRSQFHNVIDAHLRNCEIAGADAHNYHEKDQGVISVSRVDTDLEPGEDGYAEELEEIGNVGSYIAEYIGAHGEELLDRGLDELQHRAVCWATGTQRIRFSDGANAMIDAERPEQKPEPRKSCGFKIGTTREELEKASADPDDGVSRFVDGERGWSLEGVGRIDEDGEDLYEVENSAVQYVNVANTPSIDPPKRIGYERPCPATADTSIGDYT